MLLTDPIDLLLDDDGDLVVEGGDLVLSSGLPGAAQGIRIRVLTFRGEWFLDLDDGVPYFQEILGHKFEETRAREAFREAIAAAPGVVEVPSITLDFNRGTRVLTISWTARTEFGDTEDEITLEI